MGIVIMHNLKWLLNRQINMLCVLCGLTGNILSFFVIKLVAAVYWEEQVRYYG